VTKADPHPGGRMNERRKKYEGREGRKEGRRKERMEAKTEKAKGYGGRCEERRTRPIL